MSTTSIKPNVLSAMLGAAALALAAGAANAADMKKDDMTAAKPAMEKCFGIAKAAKNDCAAGAHSCAGQSTKDFDKASFVSLPAGVCAKLAGGSLTASAK
jgi:uncharacterized membrane protein